MITRLKQWVEMSVPVIIIMKCSGIWSNSKHKRFQQLTTENVVWDHWNTCIFNFPHSWLITWFVGFLCPLYCLIFFDLRIIITHLVYSNTPWGGKPSYYGYHGCIVVFLLSLLICFSDKEYHFGYTPHILNISLYSKDIFLKRSIGNAS